ncbi:MAG: hypothetical protein OHK0046_46350 [Anaerolineae bacterium]
MTSLKDTRIESESAFDYSQLPDPDAEELRQAAAYINTRLSLSYRLLVEVGRKLTDMRTRYQGIFMTWATSEFRVSYDTIANWMNTAERMGHLPDDQAALIQTRALYKLAAPSTPEQARTAAVALTSQGEQVDYRTAFILANAPETIQKRYLSEELTRDEAYDLTRVFTPKMPVEVRNFCLSAGVRSHEVVTFIWKAWQKHEATRHEAEPSRIWPEIRDDPDRSLNGLGWSVPLSEATQRDTERFVVDLQMRLMAEKASHRWEWRRMVRPLIEMDGDLYIRLGRLALLEGYQEVMLNLRVPLPGESEDG